MRSLIVRMMVFDPTRFGKVLAWSFISPRGRNLITQQPGQDVTRHFVSSERLAEVMRARSRCCQGSLTASFHKSLIFTKH